MAQARQDPCTLATLLPKQGCYSCFSESERLMLKLWFINKFGEALGNTLPSLADQLSQAACFACESDSALSALELAILSNAAGDAGATEGGVDVSTLTAAELSELIKCYRCADPKLIRAAYVLAICQLCTAAVPTPT